MIKTCPFKSTPHCSNIACSDKCVMYEDDCLIKKAFETYIKNGEPIKMKTPTAEELKKFIDMLEKTSAEPVLFKHPDLNIQHDYDEHGVDWYPHSYDDIAP